LDKQRLLKTTAALKAAEQEIKTLRAQLQPPVTPPAPTTNGG
jgi:hypothetical protein